MRKQSKKMNKVKRIIPHMYPICPKCKGICKVLPHFKKYEKAIKENS